MRSPCLPTKVSVRSIGAEGEGEMTIRILIASLIVLAVLYFWDKDYNNGRLLDGLDSMRRSIAHNVFY